jgi:hypothetical protein
MTSEAPREERQLTKAQTDHLQRLYAAFEQSQRHLNDFVTYLLAEHGLEQADEWQLTPDLTKFVREPGEP